MWGGYCWDGGGVDVGFYFGFRCWGGGFGSGGVGDVVWCGWVVGRDDAGVGGEDGGGGGGVYVGCDVQLLALLG